MSFVVLKETFVMNQNMTVIVNDSEGIFIEFETYESAEKIAKLFESNSLSGNKYTVKKLS
jgi:hypothetical protein